MIQLHIDLIRSARRTARLARRLADEPGTDCDLTAMAANLHWLLSTLDATIADGCLTPEERAGLLSTIRRRVAAGRTAAH